MAEREMMRVREPEAGEPIGYMSLMKMWKGYREQGAGGKVVIKSSERPWEQNPQARNKFLLHPQYTDAAVRDWLFFFNDIRTQSGKHRHQGGLAIFVLEGKGWTVVDGVKHEWEEGDLILLPVKPRGCEHQHFNAEPGKPCKWLAMIYCPYINALGNELEQRELAPDYKHV